MGERAEIWLHADAQGLLGTYQTEPIDVDRPRDYCYVRGNIADERLAVLKKARDTLLDDHPGDPCQMEVIKMIEDIIAKAEKGTK